MLLALVAFRSPVMMQRVLVDVSACVVEGDEVSEWVSELVSHTYSCFLVVISGNTEGLRYVSPKHQNACSLAWYFPWSQSSLSLPRHLPIRCRSTDEEGIYRTEVHNLITEFCFLSSHATETSYCVSLKSTSVLRVNLDLDQVQDLTYPIYIDE